MKIISHRGNLQGRIPERENHPSYIVEAVNLGIDVEIDVWYVDGEFYLGHDEPMHKVDLQFLMQPAMWCHAKNSDALRRMLESGVHCFWHENDCYTLTSKGIPWCIPAKWIAGGITVVLSPKDLGVAIKDCLGVCVDNPLEWKEIYQS